MKQLLVFGLILTAISATSAFASADMSGIYNLTKTNKGYCTDQIKVSASPNYIGVSNVNPSEVVYQLSKLNMGRIESPMTNPMTGAAAGISITENSISGGDLNGFSKSSAQDGKLQFQYTFKGKYSGDNFSFSLEYLGPLSNLCFSNACEYTKAP